MKLHRFGGVLLSEYGGEDSFAVGARSALVTLAGGAFDADGVGIVQQPRRISRRMILIGNDVDTQMDALLAVLARGRRLLVAQMRDETTLRQTWAKLVTAQYDRNPGTLGQQPVVVTFDQDYPYWLATADEPWYLDHGLLLNAGLLLDTGNVTTQVLSASATFTITNTGSAPIPRGRIVITVAAAASASAITIRNAANDMQIAYGGTLAAGDVLEIDLLTRTVRLNYSTDAYASMIIPDQVDWLTLEVGANPITVKATVAGTVTLTWYWSRHYV